MATNQQCHMKVLLGFVLGLGLGCGPSSSDTGLAAEPPEPPTEQATEPAAEQDTEGIRIAVPPEPGEDWRAWATEQSAVLRADAPEFHDHLVRLPPVTTRDGQLRFVHPRLHHPAVAPVLLERLLSETSPELRAALAEVLPETKGHFAMAFVDLLETEPEPGVRAAMTAALVRGQASYALEGIELSLRDLDPKVRKSAVVAAAGRHDGVTLIHLLLEALDDPAAPVRQEAARSLGVMRQPVALAKLEALLDSQDPAMRLHALRAVSRIDISRLDAAALERRTADADPKVRRLAERLRDQANTVTP
jgi:HEAT repeat protein